MSQTLDNIMFKILPQIHGLVVQNTIIWLDEKFHWYMNLCQLLNLDKNILRCVMFDVPAAVTLNLGYSAIQKLYRWSAVASLNF